MRKDNPAITIMLAQVIPTSRSPGDKKAVASLSEYIANVAAEANTNRSPIILVDLFKGFDANRDTYDSVHPNASGEEKMAQAWFKAVDKYLSK